MHGGINKMEFGLRTTACRLSQTRIGNGTKSHVATIRFTMAIFSSLSISAISGRPARLVSSAGSFSRSYNSMIGLFGLKYRISNSRASCPLS